MRKACQPWAARAPGLGGTVCADMQCMCVPMSGCAGPCPSARALGLPSHHAPRSERCFKWDKGPGLAPRRLGFSSRFSHSDFGEVPLSSLGLNFLIVKRRGAIIPPGPPLEAEAAG